MAPTKTYTKKQFIEDVKKEARALRKHATKDELDRLSFSSFDPDNASRCIYGQITLDCRSERASELILSCCKRFFERVPEEKFVANNFTQLKKQVNGEKINGVETAKQLSKARSWTIKYFSSIESYILLPKAKTKNLIAYLKGETNKLEL